MVIEVEKTFCSRNVLLDRFSDVWMKAPSNEQAVTNWTDGSAEEGWRFWRPLPPMKGPDPKPLIQTVAVTLTAPLLSDGETRACGMALNLYQPWPLLRSRGTLSSFYVDVSVWGSILISRCKLDVQEIFIPSFLFFIRYSVSCAW